jgi:hypothetical protein
VQVTNPTKAELTVDFGHSGQVTFKPNFNESRLRIEVLGDARGLCPETACVAALTNAVSHSWAHVSEGLEIVG